MAKEELVLDVKTNIGKATKDTKDWAAELKVVNEQIAIQDKVIIDLEKELLKLKKIQDSIPKGAYYAGMSDLNKKIAQTTAELKSEKLGLKELKNQQKETTTEANKFNQAQKNNNKESKEGIGNFQMMGVSLNQVKEAFLKVIPAVKAMFGTIKAAMISTGIGALIVAVGALMQSFKRSEEGQERFQRIMAAINTVTLNVKDAFSDLGEIIIDTFKDPLPNMKKFGQGLLKFLRDPTGATRDMFINATLAYKDLVETTTEEIDAMDNVTKARQKAYKIQRELLIARANADRDVNNIRLKAEDREKYNATERIELLKEAQKIEENITKEEIRAKKILVKAQEDENKIFKNRIEDKDKLAQLEAELIRLETKKLRSQRLLQTQITTAINEEKADREAATIDALFTEKEITEQMWDEIIESNNKFNQTILDNAEKTAKAQRLIDEKTADAKKKTLQLTADVAMKIAGEGSALGKAVAVSMAIMNTKEAITAALGAKPYGPWNIAQAVATGAFGMLQVRDILNTPTPGNASGGGISGGSIATASAQPPAPQMMGGTFELGGGLQPEPVQAFVVSDDITNNQDKLAAIRRRATI